MSVGYTRSRSRLSSGTSTLPSSASSPPSSWSGMQAPYASSSRTGSSVGGLSDEPAEGASGKESDLRTIVGEADHAGGAKIIERERERPLIDFTSDHEDHTPVQPSTEEQESSSERDHGAMTPGDKLRMLLRQMEHEVMSAKPVPQTPNHWSKGTVDDEEAKSGAQGHLKVDNRTSAWRTRRTQPQATSSQSTLSSPERRHVDIEDDSPPTPPPRIVNPYLNGTRRTSGNGHQRPTDENTPVRIPSRAAVLQASTSRSPPPAPAEAREPTALEHYISSHRSPPPHFPRSPSRDRSFEQDRSVSSAGSRKGKERASPSFSSPPSRSSPARHHASPSRTTTSEQRSRGHTPRKWSVDLAPDDSLAFGMDAHSLEVPGPGDLDMDEGISQEPPWEDGTDDSETEEPETGHASPDKSATDRTVRNASALGLGSPPHPESPESRRRHDHSAFPVPTQHQRRPPSTSSASPHLSPDVSRTRRNTPPRLSPKRSSASRAHARKISADTSLPPLPEPEGEAEADDEENEEAANTLSSRRAAMFRSTSRSPAAAIRPVLQDRALNQTSRPDRQSETISTPDRARMRGMAPPEMHGAHMPNGSISGSTPQPPGRWASPAKGVRFDAEADRSMIMGRDAEEEERIVHRIKLSPARSSPSSASVRRKSTPPRSRLAEGDMSFTGRVSTLAQSLTRLSPLRSSTSAPLPPSTAMRDTQSLLLEASERSARAQAAAEASQRQWLDALSSLQLPSGLGEGAVRAVKQGAGWSWWAWWLAIEGLLIFGVFRLTLDYASSVSYLANLDPFSLHHSARGAASLALSVPLPTAVSAFVVPHRGSINFFDLLERAEIWRVLEKLGLDGRPVDAVSRGLGGGVKMLGGVPS